MPTYEYECSKCKNIFEVFQSMKDEPIKKCPECGGKVKRLLGTGAGIIFKGSGFYQTDYRDSKYHSEASKEKAGNSGSAKDSTKSSDAKSTTGNSSDKAASSSKTDK